MLVMQSQLSRTLCWIFYA